MVVVKKDGLQFLWRLFVMVMVRVMNGGCSRGRGNVGFSEGKGGDNRFYGLSDWWEGEEER